MAIRGHTLLIGTVLESWLHRCLFHLSVVDCSWWSPPATSVLLHTSIVSSPLYFALDGCVVCGGVCLHRFAQI